jgi:hypothetical protein
MNLSSMIGRELFLLFFTLAGYYIACIRKITLVENETLQTTPLLKYSLFTCFVYQLW